MKNSTNSEGKCATYYVTYSNCATLHICKLIVCCRMARQKTKNRLLPQSQRQFSCASTWWQDHFNSRFKKHTFSLLICLTTSLCRQAIVKKFLGCQVVVENIFPRRFAVTRGRHRSKTFPTRVPNKSAGIKKFQIKQECH